MKLKRLLLPLILLTFLGNISYGQNRLNSRLFYLKPPLFNSKTKIENFDLSRYSITVSELIDNRSQFYGEEVFKNKKAQPLDEFFQLPTMIEIKNKISSDFSSFGISANNKSSDNRIKIITIVEVFYPDVRGFIWAKSFAKVRLNMTAELNETELIKKTYESFYITDGTDKEFEGSLMMTIEQGANVTVGMTLRKALDEFYNDLNENLK